MPTTLDYFDDSVLGDPITDAWCEQFAVRLGLSAGPSSNSDWVASGTSAPPAEGSMTAAPPMDSGEAGD